MATLRIRTTHQRSYEISHMLSAALQLFVRRGQREGALRRAANGGDWSYRDHDVAALGMLFAMPAIRAQIRALPTEGSAARRAALPPETPATVTLTMPPLEFAWLLEMGHCELERDFRARWEHVEGAAESPSRAADKAQLDAMRPILEAANLLAEAGDSEDLEWDLA